MPRRRGGAPPTRVTELPEDGAVVLATGFDRDEQLVRAFLRGLMLAPTGAPASSATAPAGHDGGGAASAMSEAWWCPATRIPARRSTASRCSGSCSRSAHGRAPDGRRQRPPLRRRGRTTTASGARSQLRAAVRAHVPAWLVFDSGYRRAHPLGPRAGRADPGLAGAGGLRRRSGRGDRRPAELEATVDRFNEGAARGEDPEHGRGSTAYDRFVGGLGPVDEAPYYALRVLPGCLGTKGGPRTDAHGRVLDRGRRAHPISTRRERRREPARPRLPRAGGRSGRRFVGGAAVPPPRRTHERRAPIEVMPLGDVLVRAARRWPESIAVRVPDRRLATVELLAERTGSPAGLHARGPAGRARRDRRAELRRLPRRALRRRAARRRGRHRERGSARPSSPTSSRTPRSPRC